jgi:hypothetical protein
MIAYRQYSYVGSHDLLQLLNRPSHRTHITSATDVLQWIAETRQSFDADKSVVATFIIDLSQQLWIADQRSEHVRCADGQQVLGAGEITFAVYKLDVEVVEITNQSTGYCPEPESWGAVAKALAKTNIPFPPAFTITYLFRRCEHCGTTNIVKDNWFECGVCQAPLPQNWNFA